jgi:hypothetical protein
LEETTMPLQSELFSGDPKLENAAVHDSAHILPGSSGPHIEKIQVALMLLDSASIATSELAADSYGATTAAAVLAYKRERNIINLSYQSTADNIVGRMTIASLDSEIAARNAIQKRSGCDYAPVGRPKRKQHFFAFAASGLELVNAGTPAASSTLDMALAAVPAALAMRNKAMQALDELTKASKTKLSALCLEALKRHYKVSAAADVDRVAREVRISLAKVTSRLLSARAWLRQGQGGGFAETPQPRDGHTYIMQGYSVAGRLMRPTILIHEAFHDLDRFNEDQGGNPAKDGGVKYHLNDTTTQLKNAYAMSQFVLHISEEQEKILNDTD